MKHAAEKVGGRLHTDHPLISFMVRHCCFFHCSLCDQTIGRLTKCC